MTPPPPEFRRRAFPPDRARRTLASCHPSAFDPARRFSHFFRHVGEIVDRDSRHLPSSPRCMFTFAMACRHFGDPALRPAAGHAAASVGTRHRHPATRWDRRRSPRRGTTAAAASTRASNPIATSATPTGTTACRPNRSRPRCGRAYFVGHKHGAWFRLLVPDHAKRTDPKGPAGKVDYHNAGACYEVLNVLPADSTPN